MRYLKRDENSQIYFCLGGQSRKVVDGEKQREGQQRGRIEHQLPSTLPYLTTTTQHDPLAIRPSGLLVLPKYQHLPRQRQPKSYQLSKDQCPSRLQETSANCLCSSAKPNPYIHSIPNPIFEPKRNQC